MARKTQWNKYLRCRVCKAETGTPCTRVRPRDGVKLAVPHRGREHRGRRGDNGTYLCVTCKEYKAPPEFNKLSKDENGIQKTCKVCARDAKYRSRFGITLTEYNAILESQGGKCALCDKECDSWGNLAVDHCHKTGKVRGLLCMKCNQSLERVEIPGWAKKAVAYINHHRRN